MNKINKDEAFVDFCNMVKKSWTFCRMTVAEQAKCLEAFQWTHDQGMLRGNYNARWSIMQAIYNSFLLGLGYDGFTWRDDPDEPLYSTF